MMITETQVRSSSSHSKDEMVAVEVYSPHPEAGYCQPELPFDRQLTTLGAKHNKPANPVIKVGKIALMERELASV